jgi:hypothetical protein
MGIRCLTLGSYQIKQSLQYTKEHMSKTGDYDISIQICNDPDKPCLIRTKIHNNSKRIIATLLIAIPAYWQRILNARIALLITR